MGATTKQALLLVLSSQVSPAGGITSRASLAEHVKVGNSPSYTLVPKQHFELGLENYGQPVSCKMGVT